jgi:lysophospholipase L1-like esterase
MKIKLLKSSLYFVLAAITCLVLFEFLLHCYNPNRSRVRNGRILLPTNQSYIFKNTEIPKIGNRIVHTKNSLGFRGPEIPSHFSDYVSIVAVGGSTTECYYLSDNESWPFLVEEHLKKLHDKVWLNNAGFDGFSTFGIAILLDEYITRIKPKYVLFLLGSNDIGQKSLSDSDATKMKPVIKSISVLEWIKSESEILDFMRILKNKIKTSLTKKEDSEARNIGHHFFDLQKLAHSRIDDRAIDRILDTHRIQYIPGYKNRIFKIIQICKNSGITPVFMTQPILVGNGVDTTTNVNLETVILENGNSGIVEWKLMELYNDTLRKCAIENNVPLIDIAKSFPKDSRFFYDKSHLGIDGAKLAADLISKGLEEIITGKR